jgi:hypothetical protein
LSTGIGRRLNANIDSATKAIAIATLDHPTANWSELRRR